MSTIGSLNYAKENVKNWMKDEKRNSNASQPFVVRTLMSLLGAKSKIKYQPLGTVGVISPWNFPINLVFKGKRAYETKIELNEKNILISKQGKSYSYTVYVDKIALKQKGGNQRLSLDKTTLMLKDANNSTEMQCESKSESELKEEFNKILSQTN